MISICLSLAAESNLVFFSLLSTNRFPKYAINYVLSSDNKLEHWSHLFHLVVFMTNIDKFIRTPRNMPE